MHEFREWRAYDELEPFGDVRADLRAAQIERALYNIFARRTGQSLYSLSDFVLRFEAPRSTKAPMTAVTQWQGIKARARAIAEAFGQQTPGATERPTT